MTIESSTPSGPARNWRLAVAVLLGLPLAMTALQLVVVWLTFGRAGGDGTVASLTSRNHTTFARFVDGGELALLGEARSVAPGDRVSKGADSFTYVVNGAALGTLLPWLLDTVLFWAIVGTAGAALVYLVVPRGK